MAYTCVTEEHLRALTVAQLSAICTKRKLQDSNKKAPMVEVLMGNGIMYKDLTVELLTALCKHYRKDILPRWRKEQIIASLLEAESEESISEATSQSGRGTTGSSSSHAPEQRLHDGQSSHCQPSRRPNLRSQFKHVPLDITQQHLSLLTVVALKAIYKRLGLKPVGNKAELVSGLLEGFSNKQGHSRSLTYDDLLVTELQTISRKLLLENNGNRQQLIDSLVAVSSSGTSQPGLQQPSSSRSRQETQASRSRRQSASESADSTASSSEQRQPTKVTKVVACCIGVGSYDDSPLVNTVKDAQDMARELERLGVEVLLEVNPDIKAFREAVRVFCYEMIKSDTELAIFYFSGHGGISIASNTKAAESLAGKHILAARCWKYYEKGGFVASARSHGLVLEENVIAPMESAPRKCNLNLIIVDACRVTLAEGHKSFGLNPEGEDMSRAWGASRLKGNLRSTLVCNACEHLKPASDGQAGQNGLYTAALLNNMFHSNHPDLFSAIEAANEETVEKSKQKQKPILSITTTQPFRIVL